MGEIRLHGQHNTVETLLQAFRENDWQVAIHNDYKLYGEHYTFYLFTHSSGIFAKGEGEDDLTALQNAMKQAQARSSHLYDLFVNAIGIGNSSLRSE